ncbi:MAG TPA: LysR family transcriptional regulator [Stellaceae bacterium]|nr:LysR family transcriptional regulator [Stellaceae bacterium]
MDRLASITAFVRVAESGGFSAAGRRLHMSKATISDQVLALENTLGARLLNRTTRRVSLTEIGRDYYERCSQILHELAEADEAASALQVTPRGHLRVYSHQGLSRFVAPVATRLLGGYAEVSLDLRTGDAMIDVVQEGFDVAIMPVSPPDSTLIRRILAKWRHVLCCAPAYLETHAVPRSPLDLADHNCLLYAYSIYGPEFHLIDRAGNFQFTDPAGNRVAGRLSGNLITTSIEVLRQAVVAGLGLWLCPPLIVSDLLVSGALLPLLPDYAGPEMEIVALYPHRRQLSAKVRLLLDLLSDQFAEEQGRHTLAGARHPSSLRRNRTSDPSRG